MYIKLTRMDNTPIWINAAFVVTVEPRRQGGGSIVVPIGDGLDYDVRETPEAVLAMLEGAPAPVVVPVPPPKSLTKPPVDVFAESTLITAAEKPSAGPDAPELAPAAENAAKPHKRGRRGRGRRKHQEGNSAAGEQQGDGKAD